MQQFFDPQTVAVIGATDRRGSVGRGLMENLLENSDRRIIPVNPNHDEVLNVTAYPDVASIPEEVDLAVIAIPQQLVKSAIEDCAGKKVKGVIIISAGFGETGPEGKEQEQEIKKILDDNNIPFIGPNCLGILRPATGLNASFAPGSAKPGGIAFISQSGAFLDSIIDGNQQENYGFSFLVSPGNAAGLQLSDYINWAEQDAETKVIALYIEGLENGREFYETIKSTTKPVAVLKPGKSETARKAISSHTGSLAGQAPVFSAVLKQAGAIEAHSIQELLDISKALSWQPRFDDGIAIITNGGGAGVLATDYLETAKLPELRPETLKQMTDKMHPGYSAANPLDIVGDALPERYQAALEAVLGQDDIQAVVVIQTLQIMTDPQENAKIILQAAERFRKPVVACFMGAGPSTQEAVSLLERGGIPNYSDPARAAGALLALRRG